MNARLSFSLALLLLCLFGSPSVHAEPGPATANDLHMRLRAVSHAVNDFALLPQNGAVILSVSNHDKPKPEWTSSAIWCESLLQDVIALRNIEPVADVGDQGPIWVKENGYIKRSESIDPAFSIREVHGRKLVSGYVNVRWDNKYLLTLRVDGNCVGEGEVHRRCTGPVHSRVWVYGPDAAHSCNAGAADRLAWPYWMHKETVIQLTPGGASSWLKIGSATDGRRAMTVFLDYASLDLTGNKPKAALRLDYDTPQPALDLPEKYSATVTEVDIDCGEEKLRPVSRRYLFDNGGSLDVPALRNNFEDGPPAETGAFIKSLCFLKNNGFDRPDIGAGDRWDAMTSPVAGNRISEAKAGRQYRNGYLLVKQRNDFKDSVDIGGVPARQVVLLSAFDCRHQTMNRLMTVVYGPNRMALGANFFDAADTAPRLPENRKRLTDACAELGQ